MNRRLKHIGIAAAATTVGLLCAFTIWFHHESTIEAQSRAVMEAIKSQDAKSLQTALESGANPNIFDIPQTHRTVKEVVKDLLQRSRSQAAYPTALEVALMQRSEIYKLPAATPEIVHLLLRHGADPRINELYGRSPLLILFESIRLPGSQDWEPPAEDPAMLKELLDAGAKTDERDKGGQTPLILCAQYGFTESVKLLIEHGADINAVDSGSIPYSPLKWAEYRGDAAMVRFLKAKGASR